MTLIRWRPMNDVFNTLSELTTFAEDIFEDSFSENGYNDYPVPPADVVEDDDKFILTMEVPGLGKKDVKVRLTDNLLTVSGEKSEQKTDKGNRYTERWFGKFERSFTLDPEIDIKKIKAAYKDGILRIELPKKESAKPKEISVKVN